MRISDWSSDVCSSDLAAEGRGHEAVRAMQVEAEIRIDPFQRADRFVEGWQQLRQQHQELVRDGNFRGAKTTAQHMADMANSLERAFSSVRCRSRSAISSEARCNRCSVSIMSRRSEEHTSERQSLMRISYAASF